MLRFSLQNHVIHIPPIRRYKNHVNERFWDNVTTGIQTIDGEGTF